MSAILAPGRPKSRTLTIQPSVVTGTLLFSLVLIRLPALFGEGVPLLVYGLTLAPFCAAIVSLSLWRASWQASTAILLVSAYVVLIVVAALRGSYFGAISSTAAALEGSQVALVAVLGAFAFLREPRAYQRSRYLRALCWAPVVFLAANVVLYFAGVLPPDQPTTISGQPSTMIGLLGVPMERVAFPLAGGVNGIGPTAVAALAICAVFWRRREQRGLAIFGVLISLCVILLIDSRGALLFAALAVALVELAPRVHKRRFGWVAIALPVLPILLIAALTGFVQTDVGSQLDRGPTESLSTGTGRTVVWGEALEVVTEPRVESLIGYGRNGQVTSGASLGYAYLFGSDRDALAKSAHSVFLQTALDTGWLGVLAFIALAWVVLNRAGRLASDARYAALLTAALALLLLGVVQTNPTPAHPDSFAFWLLVVLATMRAQPATLNATSA